MRKLFTIALFILLAISAFAQKDIEFKLLSPVNGQETYVDETFNLVYSFKNVGNEEISFEDSFFVSLKIDGDYILGGFNKKFIEHNNIPPGDSVYYLEGFGFKYKEPNPILFCFEFTTRKNGVAIDSNFLNNLSCATITVDERTTGITEFDGNFNLSLYPNPATNGASLKTNNPSASKVILTDIIGREITVLLLQNGSADFDISSLQNGLYFCTIISDTGEFIAKERLIVKELK